MVRKAVSDKIREEATSLTKEILRLIGIEAEVEATTEEDLIKIKVLGDDLGLLIGYRGENLESLQLLLGIGLNNKLGAETWHPVLVDVGNWRAQREEALRSLVDREVGKLSADRHFIDLPPMPPAQRRTVHLLVEQHEGLTSESSGEGASRHVVIKRIEKR